MNNTVNKTSRYAAAVFHLCKDECLFKIGSKNSFSLYVVLFILCLNGIQVKIRFNIKEQ